MSIDLVPLPSDGLELVEAWMLAAHVRRWWKPAWSDPVVGALRAGTAMPDTIRPWRIDLDGRAIGYAQDYAVAGAPDTWSAVEDVGPDARGIDLLIGDPQLVSRRHGREAIRVLTARLFGDPAVDRVVARPQPDNWPAIIAFKKVGFRDRGRRVTRSGPIMLLSAARSVWRP